jgi:hypothetical protein
VLLSVYFIFPFIKLIGISVVNFRCHAPLCILFFLVFSSYAVATVSPTPSNPAIPVGSINTESNKDTLDLNNNPDEGKSGSIYVSKKYPEQRMLELEYLVEIQGNIINELQAKLDKQPSQLIDIKDLESKLSEYSDAQNSISFVEYTGIALACVAILITALGIGVAILSVWGYNNIKKSTDKISNEVANEVATRVASSQAKTDIPEIVKSQLSEQIKEGKFNDSLQDAVDMIMRNNKARQESVDYEMLADIDNDQEDT